VVPRAYCQLSKAKFMSKVRLQNHLTDVAGVEEAKAELLVVDFSKILPVLSRSGLDSQRSPVGRPSGTG